MQKSNNQQVQTFLDELLYLNETFFIIIQELRKKVFFINPKVQERIMYGWIMFSLENDFWGVFVSKNHISFEFGKWYLMNDPNNFLEWTWKLRRHLKFHEFDDIEKKNIDFFLQQAI